MEALSPPKTEGTAMIRAVLRNATAASIADYIWSLEEIAALLD